MNFNFKKVKEDSDFFKILEDNLSSDLESFAYNNRLKERFNTIDFNNFENSRLRKTKPNLFNNDYYSNNLNAKRNISKYNNKYVLYPPNKFNSFEHKSKKNSDLKNLEKIMNKNLIKNKFRTPAIQENITIKNKTKIENIKKIINGINNKKKEKLISTPFHGVKDKLIVKDKDKDNIIELYNKLKEYEKDKQKYENNINQLNEKINTREKNIRKEIEELQEKGRIEIEKIKSELNKYINENIKIKEENKMLSMKNKELEEEIKEIKSKYQSQERITNEEILKAYKNPTLIGLNDAHNIFNTILQCLSQTGELTSYFLNNKNIEEIINDNNISKDKNDKKLTPIYLKLIQNLWNMKGTEAYSADIFMNNVKNMNPLFGIENVNNLKEFIIFIIEQIHRELRKPKIKNNNKINETLKQYDRNNIFNYCYNKFKEESSIISDLFFGLKEASNECLNCRNIYNLKGLSNKSICYNYEMFDCLIFPLEEIKNIKNNYMRNNYFFQNNNNYISLNDCFNYNQRLEYYTGDNKNYCNICKQLSDFCYNSKIFFSPKILILIMKRDQENEYNLFFEEELDISEFVYSKDVPLLKYNLYGVISDIGKKNISHFVSSCKSSIDNKWYRYDDTKVIPITNVEKDVIQYGNPYILFYKKL